MSENNYRIEDDEITLKELILKIKEFWNEVIKHWIWIIGISAALGLFMGIKAYKTKSVYNAKLTFMVNDDEGGNGFAAIGGLLGSFGLGGSKGGKNNLDKILELSKTRKISQYALFEKVEIGGKNDFLANHIIEYKDTLGEWASLPFYNFWSPEPVLKDFRFKSQDIASFVELENEALKTVFYILVGSEKSSGFLASGYSEESGIMYLSATSENQDLSILICNKVYEKLSEYYVTKTVEKQQFSFDIVKSKYDSIQVALKNAQYQLAKFEDRNQNLFARVDKLQEIRLNQEVQKLGIMYGEAAKNMEFADFSLKNKTPFVQEIDRPILPLTPTKPSMFRSLIIGGFLGAFLSIGFIVCRKIYSDTMN